MDATHLYFFIVAPQVTSLHMRQKAEQVRLMDIEPDLPFSGSYRFAPDDSPLLALLLTERYLEWLVVISGDGSCHARDCRLLDIDLFPFHV
jgi:hypothetical protein